MSTAAGGAAKTAVILGTATPGGGFPVYGAAVTDTIHEVDSTLAIEQRNTKGSTENVPLLEAGRLDIALVQGEVAHEAFNGIGRAPSNLRIVARCTRRRGCSSFAPTRRTGGSEISAASRWPSGPAARGL